MSQNLCRPEVESEGPDSQHPVLHQPAVFYAHKPSALAFDDHWVALVYESAVIITFSVTYTTAKLKKPWCHTHTICILLGGKRK